jgi:LPXTG-motif cell wall-anchored protein
MAGHPPPRDPVLPPTMPGERDPNPWWPIPSILLGVLLLVGAAGVLGYRRFRHA